MNSSIASSQTLHGEAALAAAIRIRRKRAEKHRAKHAALIREWAEDFTGFAAELDVVDKGGNRVPVRPTAMLTAFEAERTGWDVVLKPRQVYFTTWELVRDIHYFLVRPNANVVIICQTVEDDIVVKEIARRIQVMFGLDLPEEYRRETRAGLLGKHPELDVWEKSETEWRFGSARLSVRDAGGTKKSAEAKHRGPTIHRLHITELSSFAYADETWKSLLETVPKSNPHAEIVIESTARGAAGRFYRLYQDAKKGASSFKAHFFRWLSHREYRLPLEPGETIRAETPREKEMVKKYRASAEQVKWYRAKCADAVSQDVVDQEYPIDEETCWLSAGRLYLHKERIKELLTLTRDPVRIEDLPSSVPDPAMKYELRIWKEPHARDTYVVIADPSEGVVGGDPCAAAIYHRATGEHVASIHGLWRTHEFAALLDKIGRRYNNALLVVERVNHGHAVLNALLRLEIREDEETKRPPYPNVYHDEDGKPGWKTGQVPRSTAMENFEESVRLGTWSSPDRDALVEMQKFIINEDGKPEAAPGEHDDRVLVHVIGWKILSVPIPRKPGTGNGGSRYGGGDGRGFY